MVSSVKVRRGGVGTHFCLHRYFFDTDPSWKEIREEENLAEAKESLSAQPNPDEEDENYEEDGATAVHRFPPIDARHLSSLPLVSARIVKLLKMSKNNMHAANNIILKLESIPSCHS